MKNNVFAGWNTVFSFTLKQGFTKGYKLGTLIFALILLMAGIGANLFLADRQKKEEKISPVEKVYVYDESGIQELKLSGERLLDEEQFPKVVFEPAALDFKELGVKLASEEGNDVIAQITAESHGYQVMVYVPDESRVKKEDAKNLAKAIRTVVRQSLIATSGIEKEKVTYIVSSTQTKFLTAGENAQSTGQRVLTVVLPICLMMFMYFMVLIYGQNMGNIVTVEKSSKLVETLLVMTKPYGIIFGKIFATTLTAIFQVLLWGASIVAGFVAGDVLARQVINPEYDNFFFEILSQLAADDSLKAFTVEAIILGVVTLCVAFLFYCVLAGAIASFAGKAEELGQVMMFYNMFLIIGFFGSYALPNVTGQGWVKVVLRIIPFTGAFLLPGEILVGTVPVVQGILYLLLLMAWIAGLCVFAGRVYKNQLFYKGKSLMERLKRKKKKSNEEESIQPFDREESTNRETEWQVLAGTVSEPEKTQRMGYFFVAISTVAIFFVLQLLASMVVMNVMTRVQLRGVDVSAWETKDYVNLYHRMENTLNPLTMLVCHICVITCFGLWYNCALKNKPGMGKQSILDAWENLKTNKATKPLVTVLCCIVLGVSLCFFANGTIVVEAYLIPNVVANYLEMAKSAGLGKSIFAILATVVCAPIGEELLCRGVCLHFGKKAFGRFWIANLLQALMFGIMHANWVQGIYAFLIGLVLGYMVERYNSLLPAMFIHFVVNFSSSTWVPLLFRDTEGSFMLGLLLIGIPALVVCPVIMFIERRYRKQLTIEENE